MIDLSQVTRDDIEGHSTDLRQFIDFRQSRLENGMRIVEAYNGSGLSFTVLPDRGLDIWSAHYNGRPLTWLAQGSPVPADFGSTWLRQFNGGLLTTCGLTFVGPPEVDDVTGEHNDLHGKYTRLGAQRVNVEGEWLKNDEYVLELSGVVTESRLFGEQLRLERTYSMTLGKPTIEIEDTITNIGDMPAPLMLLYHFNVGFPLVREGAKLHTAHHVVHPRDEEAKKGYDNWADYKAPIPQYAEQVYWHHPKLDSQGYSKALVGTDEFSLMLTFSADTLPLLTQWKNYREGIYVCGVEPSNCLAIGRNASRESGRLETIEPGDSINYYNNLTIIEGADAVSAAVAEVNELKETGLPSTIDISDYAV